MSNVIAVLNLIANAFPEANVHQALGLAEKINDLYPAVPERHVFDWKGATVQERAAHTRTLPVVMDHLPEKKIMAIKALRDHAGAGVLGLKEAKDVIDLIAPMPAWRSCCDTRTTDSLHGYGCYNR